MRNNKWIITEENVVQYYDIDLNNCHLTREDFCGIIADILNKPIKESKYLKKEIYDYFFQREIRLNKGKAD